ncbi:MAG: response regulator transcription factor [SAR324 cluster bacterium]|nr:response regulator transcription factor [SAR324 cluster bacterium]
MDPTILIIDDDEKLCSLLQNYLKDFGFQVLLSTDPDAGLKKLRDFTPDLIILDVMLPGMDGFEVCKTIRKTHSVPIIMLTARGEVMDRIVGLEIGADDYMPKPFEPRELVARIQSILRRAQGTENEETLQFGEMKIDFSKQSVFLKEENVNLTTTEFTALSFLVRNPGKVLNRDQILDALKGMESEAFNRTVDITMSRLRHKLRDDAKQPNYIKTVWGAGYAFIGKAQEN